MVQAELAKDIPCGICGNQTANEVWLAEEKMFGLGGAYQYLACNQCHCLQLLNPPADLGKFYPKDYYSYRSAEGNGIRSRLAQWVRTKRAAVLSAPNSIVANFLLKRFPNAGISSLLPLPLGKDSRILDVGCGNGALLYDLAENGFQDLTGVDPFISKDIHYSNGATVLKQNLAEVNGSFDLIMMHHAFEHMDSPLDVLVKARERLLPTGVLLIRIPVANASVWHTYKTNWVQLDAPRHLFLHTEESVSYLAKKAGLKLRKVIYDSTGFQFWGSETYKAGKNLVADPMKQAQPDATLFNKGDLKRFEAMAAKANVERTADQAAFYLELDND